MKRSEAVKEIYNVLTKHKDCCNDWSQAALILSTLEEAGMLPPRVKIEGTQFSDNCWEKE